MTLKWKLFFATSWSCQIHVCFVFVEKPLGFRPLRVASILASTHPFFCFEAWRSAEKMYHLWSRGNADCTHQLPSFAWRGGQTCKKQEDGRVPPITHPAQCPCPSPGGMYYYAHHLVVRTTMPMHIPMHLPMPPPILNLLTTHQMLPSTMSDLVKK